MTLWHYFDDQLATDQMVLICLRHFGGAKFDGFCMLVILYRALCFLSEHHNVFLDHIHDL